MQTTPILVGFIFVLNVLVVICFIISGARKGFIKTIEFLLGD